MREFGRKRFGERRGFGDRGFGGPRFGDRPFGREAPVKEGEEHDVEITEVSARGDGVARIKNFVVFVPNTKKGDKVHIKITALRGRAAIAEVVGGAEGPVEAEAEAGAEGEPEAGLVMGSEESEEGENQ